MNEYRAWKGAIEPSDKNASGNEYQAWKGAVEPYDPTEVPSGATMSKKTNYSITGHFKGKFVVTRYF